MNTIHILCLHLTYQEIRKCKLLPPLGAYWDACIYVRIFLGWMGFYREAKRHLLTAFSYKPGLFCGILLLQWSYENRESVVN